MYCTIITPTSRPFLKFLSSIPVHPVSWQIKHTQCRFIADWKGCCNNSNIKKEGQVKFSDPAILPQMSFNFLPCVWPCTTFAWCNLSIFAILEMAVVMHLGWMTLTFKTTRFNLSRVKNKEGSCLRNFLLQNESLSVNTCKLLPHSRRKKVNGYQKAVKLKKSRMEGDVWKTSLILIFLFRPRNYIPC